MSQWYHRDTTPMGELPQLGGQGLGQRPVGELEAGLVQHRRHRPSAVDQLVGEFAQRDPQRELGHDPRRRPVQLLTQLDRKSVV